MVKINILKLSIVTNIKLVDKNSAIFSTDDFGLYHANFLNSSSYKISLTEGFESNEQALVVMNGLCISKTTEREILVYNPKTKRIVKKKKFQEPILHLKKLKERNCLICTKKELFIFNFRSFIPLSFSNEENLFEFVHFFKPLDRS